MNIKELQTLTEEMFKMLGISVTVESDAAPYIGDDTLESGSLTIDGWMAIYPSRDGGGLGFAIDRLAVVRGVRTFRNGDPGYPDEVEAHTIHPCVSPMCQLTTELLLERIAGLVTQRRVNVWFDCRKEDASLEQQARQEAIRAELRHE